MPDKERPVRSYSSSRGKRSLWLGLSEHTSGSRKK